MGPPLRLQVVQNAARQIAGVRKFYHIIKLWSVCTSFWFASMLRFKVLVLMYQVLNSLRPQLRPCLKTSCQVWLPDVSPL